MKVGLPPRQKEAAERGMREAHEDIHAALQPFPEVERAVLTIISFAEMYAYSIDLVASDVPASPSLGEYAVNIFDELIAPKITQLRAAVGKDRARR